MSATHAELVQVAATWLRKKCSVVVTEIATTGEEPDAIGWHGNHSTLIECKATRADFMADRMKGFRRQTDRGIGQARYFLTPPALVAIFELPPGWGLIEYDGEKTRCLLKSEHFAPSNHRHELTILLSVIRRLGKCQLSGVSVKHYTIETRSRTTVGIEPDDEIKPAHSCSNCGTKLVMSPGWVPSYNDPDNASGAQEAEPVCPKCSSTPSAETKEGERCPDCVKAAEKYDRLDRRMAARGNFGIVPLPRKCDMLRAAHPEQRRGRG